MALVAEAAQKAAVCLGYPSLREHQLEAVVSFVSGKDVFCRVDDRIQQELVLCLSTTGVRSTGGFF